ncbi:MAG: SH3 domain-containing protein [Anaerolineales bacterium]
MLKSHSNPILFTGIVLLIVSLACTVPSVAVPTSDPNFIGTLIFQTVAAAATQTGAAVSASQTAAPTFTPAPPTLTPTATLSPTPVFTATALVPQISVSVATNCRVGPGRVYDRVGALLAGEVAEVVARNPMGNYWYIRNPDNRNEYCWLWGEYATVSGNFLALPMFTPPPTPTPIPAFAAKYHNLQTCVGWWVNFKVTNTGTIAFKSLSITVKDTDEGTSVSMSSDAFTEIDGCLDSATKDTLDPGATRTVSAPAFAYDPTGHKLRVTLTLCTGNDQNGTCITDSFRFTPK